MRERRKTNLPKDMRFVNKMTGEVYSGATSERCREEYLFVSGLNSARQYVVPPRR